VRGDLGVGQAVADEGQDVDLALGDAVEDGCGLAGGFGAADKGLDPAAPAMTTPSDGRGSPIPTLALIATRFMELRKRRGPMTTLFLVTVGIPTVFLGVRLVLHAVAPKTYGPAGGYDIYTALTAGVLYTFGFSIVCAVCMLAAPSSLASTV